MVIILLNIDSAPINIVTDYCQIKYGGTPKFSVRNQEYFSTRRLSGFFAKLLGQGNFLETYASHP